MGSINNNTDLIRLSLEGRLLFAVPKSKQLPSPAVYRPRAYTIQRAVSMPQH